MRTESQHIRYTIEEDDYMHVRDRPLLDQWLNQTLGGRGMGTLKITIEFTARA